MSSCNFHNNGVFASTKGEKRVFYKTGPNDNNGHRLDVLFATVASATDCNNSARYIILRDTGDDCIN